MSPATNDRMRSVDEAVKQLAASLSAIADVETILLARADGRVLVQDLVAPIELPPLRTRLSTDTRCALRMSRRAVARQCLSPLA